MKYSLTVEFVCRPHLSRRGLSHEELLAEASLIFRFAAAQRGLSAEEVERALPAFRAELADEANATAHNLEFTIFG